MLRAQPDAVAAVLFVTAWGELEVKVRRAEGKEKGDTGESAGA